MAIKYYRLLDLLGRRGMSKGDLQTAIKVSSGTLAKLSSNENVSLWVIDRICRVLDCQPGDIMEHTKD